MLHIPVPNPTPAPQPPSIPFVSAAATWKGGSGKTTIAVNLAVAAMEAGETPLLLDADPTQELHTKRPASERLPWLYPK